MSDAAVPRPPQPPARPALVTLTLDLPAGPAPFRIAAEGTAPPAFCLGIRKSGSSLLNRIVQFLAQRNGIHPVDIPGTMFRTGVLARDWIGADLGPLIRPGNLYLGFRTLPPGLAAAAAFGPARKVFMFRDPRDSLVSQYFSDAFSHGLPEDGPGRAAFEEKRAKAQATPIDDYVLQQARILGRTMMEYAPLLDDPACMCMRYESHLFLKRRLVAKVLRHFGWTAAPGQIEKLMADVDVIPEGEEPTRFLRRAIPGDHRATLRPDPVAKLDRILAEPLARYDYV